MTLKYLIGHVVNIQPHISVVIVKV